MFEANKDKIILVQLRIKSEVNYYSLSKIQSVSFSSKDALINIFNLVLSTLYEKYTQFPIAAVSIRYSILPEGSQIRKPVLRSASRDNTHYAIPTQFSLPETLDLSKWGNVQILNSSLTLVNDGKRSFLITSNGDVRSISIMVNHSDILMSFTDNIIDLHSDEFVRTLDNGQVISFKGGAQVKLVHKQKETAFIEKVRKDTSESFSAITLDLETQRMSDGNLRVISGVTYDGDSFNTYFLNDYTSSDDLIFFMINDLFTSANDGKTVYAHNLSGFDGIFILKTLAGVSDKFNIVRKDDKIICITVSVGEKK